MESKTAGVNTHPVEIILKYLYSFARNPVDTIKRPLLISWTATIALQVIASMISGTLAGLLSGNLVDALIGLLIFPISSVLISFLFTLFIYYYFTLVHSTFLEARRLYSIIVLATLPYLVIHIVAEYLPPLDLIGFAFTSLLLVVGICEQFSIERKQMMRLVGGLYLAFIVIWSLAQIKSHRGESLQSQESFLQELEQTVHDQDN